MALGSLPTLSQINTELGLSLKSLVYCIANAGKTGVFLTQKAFAGYSNTPQTLSISPNLFDLGKNASSGNMFTVITDGGFTITYTSVSWVTGLPSSGSYFSLGTAFSFSVILNAKPPRSLTVTFTSDNAIVRTLTINQSDELEM